jgi:uncharacterized protein
MSLGTVAALWRYPVKSMLGEELPAAQVTERGVVGDRAWAVVDRADGRVASAKNPAKWKRLLELRPRFVDEPSAGQPSPPVEISFPDGSTARTDNGADEAVSRFLGRDVSLVATPPESARFEEVWPSDVGPIAPEEFVSNTRSGTSESGEAVSDITLAMAAPPGTFFDLSPLHVITSATLAALRSAAPSADFDVRRYRPNLLIDCDAEGFVENGWPGTELQVGECRIRADLATMRCVMTTLPHGEVPADRETLRTIARENRIEIPGLGTWACAGAYATPTAAGQLRVGDVVATAS